MEGEERRKEGERREGKGREEGEGRRNEGCLSIFLSVSECMRVCVYVRVTYACV